MRDRWTKQFLYVNYLFYLLLAFFINWQFLYVNYLFYLLVVTLLKCYSNSY